MEQLDPGSTQVLDDARRVGDLHVVLVPSSSIYGTNTELPKRESMVALPVSPYAASKLATESCTLAWQHTYGLPTLAFRFFNVFGPMQAVGHAYAAIIPEFVSAELDGRPLPVHGEGTQSRVAMVTFRTTTAPGSTSAVLFAGRPSVRSQLPHSVSKVNPRDEPGRPRLWHGAQHR